MSSRPSATKTLILLRPRFGRSSRTYLDRARTADVLNALAHRQAQGIHQSGSIMIKGTKASKAIVQPVTSYVEQEDA